MTLAAAEPTHEVDGQAHGERDAPTVPGAKHQHLGVRAISHMTVMFCLLVPTVAMPATPTTVLSDKFIGKSDEC